jgi:glycosyltransferase involved in cell wall biosynthesis
VPLDSSIFNKNAFPWVDSEVIFESTKTYPKVTVVVPSYNQSFYLEETLLSIIRQNYPSLELIVIDGGSTDNSVEVIKKYENHIAYWVSEKDRGQSHAINKGFEKATGEWIAWMNSDDCYLEGALKYIFNDLVYSNYDLLLGFCSVGESMTQAADKKHPDHSRKEIKDLLKFFYHIKHIIPSQSVFVRKSLVDNAGLLDESLHYCMDMEWYVRMYLQEPRIFEYDKVICFFRKNETTKTVSQGDKMQKEAIGIAQKYKTYLGKSEQKEIESIILYHTNFIVSGAYLTKTSILELVKIFFQSPFLAINDRRFLGAVRKSLF